MATIFRMSQENLDIMTGPEVNGIMGSTGTTSNTQYCDNTAVHCCYKTHVTIQNPEPEVYQLVTSTCTYDIEVGPT